MPLLRWLIPAVLALGGCRCPGIPLGGTRTEPLAVAPVALDFGQVPLRASKDLELIVTNRARASRHLELVAPAGFQVEPASLDVGGGEELTLVVRFAPLSVGLATASLTVDATQVALAGEGVSPACVASDPCRTSSFELQSARCVELDLPDQTDCVASNACFASAVCVSGVCVGALTTCDDQDACTLDVCGASGCGHVNDLFRCPSPADPCRTASCEPTLGCVVVDVPDGTACGARDCQSAMVCISGACARRVAPQNQACVEVVVGRPGGTGSADGVGVNARFGAFLRIATDLVDNVWLTDGATLRKVTPGGVVTTIAGRNQPTTMVDGFGSAAGLLNPRDLAVMPSGEIVFWDTGTLRRASPAGLIATWAGDGVVHQFPTVRDGIGRAASIGHGYSVTAGSSGALWLLDGVGIGEPILLRHVSALGEVVTTQSLGAGDPIGIDLAESQGTLIYSEASQGVRRLSPDAGVSWLAGPGVRRVSASPDGVIALASLHDLRVLRPDGGSAVFPLPASQSVMDVAPLSRGRWVVALAQGETGAPTASRLAIIDPSGAPPVLLAGPDWPLPPGDGPVAQVGLDDPQGVAIDSQGDLFVSETDRIRRISGGVVSTWTQFSQPGGWRDLAAPRSGGLLGTVPEGVMWWPAPDAGVLLIAAGSSGVDALDDQLGAIGAWAWLGTIDGGLSTMTGAPIDLALDGVGGFFRVHVSLSHVDALGTETTIAGVPNSLGDVDGPGTSARFGFLWSIARDPAGNFYVTDRTNRSIRKISPSGFVSTVIRLADEPHRLLVEDGGTLLVTVPDAVLRIRP